MTSNIHDSGYKKLFANRTIFRQLIETFINEPWVHELDFSQCETLDKSFISSHYKETESDLIYQVRLKERTIFFYILIEFQSTVDYYMVIRVLHYITSFYLDYRVTYGQQRLPAVFPLVLYNGERSWTAPQTLDEVIEGQPSLGAYAPHFRYWLVDENRYSREQLLAIRNIVSTLFLAEAHYDIALLESELLNLYEQESDKQAVSLFLNWFKQLATHGRVSEQDYAALDYVYRTKEEVRTMLMKTLEQERRSIYQAGKAEGHTQGVAQGVAQGIQAQQQTILQLVAWRFQPSEEEQAELIQHLAQIHELSTLATLVNALLQIKTIEEFIALLPAPEA